MIREADEISTAYICKNLRELDRKEVYALRPHEDYTALAIELYDACSMKWVFSRENRPAAFLGLREMWSGVWDLHFVTTEDFPRCVMAFTHFVKKCIIPTLFKAGAHRAQVMVLAEYTQARDLLYLLGAKEQTVLRQFGRNQEDFVLCQWLREDVENGQPAPRRFSREGAQSRGRAQGPHSRRNGKHRRRVRAV